MLRKKTVKKYRYKNPIQIFKSPKGKKIFFSNVLILFGIIFVVSPFIPVLKDEIWYKLKTLKDQKYSLSTDGQQDSVFARFLSSSPVTIDPVNKEFSLVIEKIGVNAPVIPDVPITNESAYIESLKNGIAHASISPYPSEKPGNVYLFAHASTNFWQLGKYATVFNLLRKLEIGDKVHVFYDGKDYVYEVQNKEVHKGWNTYPITRSVIEPTLTLQTCDPPGTTINRLVVTSKLVDVLEQ